MNAAYNPWTLKKIIIGKMFQFLVLTWIFTIALNKLTDKTLTYFMQPDIATIYTYNYTLGSIGLILAVPAALCSILIIKGLISLSIRLSHTPFAKKQGLSNYLNKFGAEPEGWYSSFLFPIKVVKVFLEVLLFVIKVLIRIMIAFFRLVNAITPTVGKGGSGGTPFSSASYSSNSNNEQKLRNEAQWKAGKKQKEADYAWTQAAKQAQYNSNTHHFDTRVNRAQAKQHEADRAAKRARNL